MGKINTCLKCLFIFFNVLFAIIGCILVFGAIKSSTYSSQLSSVGGPSLAWAWVIAIGVLCISSLGIYAGVSEKPLALKIFAGFMGIGMIIMLIFGIVVVVARNTIKQGFDSASEDIAKVFMDNEETQMFIEALQQTYHCCGVASAKDWGNKIPISCECTSYVQGGCKAKPAGTSGPNQIYAQTCGQFIYALINFVFEISMGLCFGFAITALLGLLVSLLMIHQVKHHDSEGAGSMAMKGY